MIDTRMHKAFSGHSPSDQWVVRLYDVFDGWVGGHEILTAEEALDFWNKHTSNGTKNLSCNDGDYWHIFPADTRMFQTPESRGQ